MACLLKAGIVKPTENVLIENSSAKTPIARQWLGSLHVKAATDMYTTIEAVLEAMFPV